MKDGKAAFMIVKTGIADSGRNRPDALQNPATDEANMAEITGNALLQMVESGLPPDDVAALVLAAVKDERFYILTHPELNEGIRLRMEDFLEERLPTMRMFL
jgi:hypothetical protein